MKFLSSVALVLSSSLLSGVAAAITRQEIEQLSAAGFHLIDLAPDVEPVWKTEEEVEALIAEDVRFFDVTEVYDPERVAAAASKAKVKFAGDSVEAAETNSLLATYAPPSRQAQAT
ncbi:hypothetical protein NLJ89_g11696 [Agrocybe chaxingu]|uniref:Uncharacterized protein n=1 Tax=Agrocybe chaxingu TaxID=84603 RepID=A0A9W8MP56_9AGAR|nr:hypothetical protein NLJ89_g11696 [Agrocybe chaxingu]